MTNLPSGTVTFLFTDIEGSTKIAQQYPNDMPVLLARHNQILNQAIKAHNGFVFQIVGDSFSAAFHNAIDGLNAVLAAQRALHTETWGETGAIKVRMGLHTGTAEILSDGKYDGYATIASTQRVMSAAHGEQTLLTQTPMTKIARSTGSILSTGHSGACDLINSLILAKFFSIFSVRFRAKSKSVIFWPYSDKLYSKISSRLPPRASCSKKLCMTTTLDKCLQLAINLKRLGFHFRDLIHGLRFIYNHAAFIMTTRRASGMS